MKRMAVLMVVLLVPTAAMAGECTPDKLKFCKEVIDAKGNLGNCLKEHKAELSEACRTKLESKAKPETPKQ
jgi:hypothetical protein